jgi:type IV secretory pathway VirB2 component (pilin)
METLWTKITSRKFLAAVSVIVTGIVMMFSGQSQDQAAAIVDKIVGGLSAAATAVAYIISEAKVDAGRQ